MSETETTPEGTPEAAPEVTPEPDLGDAGKKALSAERTARKDAERARDEALAEVKRLQRTNAAQRPDDLEAVKAEIRGEFEARLLMAEAKTQAAGRLVKPDAVKRYPEYFEGLAADDADGIKAAIDKLLADEEHLAAKPSGPQPWGDVGGGPRPDAEPEPASPLDRMTRAYSKHK